MSLVGVDMSVQANSIVTGTLTALADCDAWLGAKAAFVMRYLTPGADAANPVAVPLDAAEVDWILNTERRALGLVANGTTVAGVAAGWQQGLTDAARHVGIAKALGVPTGAGIVLWWDIEADMAPVESWLQAVIEATLQAGYLPGFYTAPTNQAFRTAFSMAMRQDGGNTARARLWYARWVSAAANAANAPAWNPGGAIAGTSPTAWQWSGGDFGDVADEDEIGTTLALSGLWLPQGAAAAPKAPESTAPSSGALAGLQRLVAVQGTVDAASDSLSIPVGFTGPGGTTQDLQVTLDTGAFELLLDGQTAQALGLPNQGAIQVSGVTGSSAAYYSQVDVTLGGQQFPGVHCVVDPESPMRLFGLRFSVDRKLSVVANAATGAVEWWGVPA